MAKTTRESRSERTQRGLAWCVLATLFALCTASSARAEDSRSASAKLTVTALVASSCSVSAASVSVGEDGRLDTQAANDAVALRCAQGVQVQTQVAYETLVGASSSDDQHLVVTVAF